MANTCFVLYFESIEDPFTKLSISMWLWREKTRKRRKGRKLTFLKILINKCLILFYPEGLVYSLMTGLIICKSR